MVIRKEPSKVYLWVSRGEVRAHVLETLAHAGAPTESVESFSALMERLAEVDHAIVILDSEAIHRHGPTIYGRLRAACKTCRVILLCAQDSRGLIREAMEAGVYGCVVEPYAPWEIQTMVRHILADFDHELVSGGKNLAKNKTANEISHS
ncbi:response regulator [Desulfosoma caldarium]|uniref:Response regulator receiver domain-containing protein n=1 Tax=Desulfosoma caldarium TaxID=610254 RepID=A0A3N1UXL5_9BACT|nr:response regulator [Desulfosoma caldarium]ROQ93420.1 response regulator receiver domain-containing protein [Desulfosoma caldarium]